MNLLFICSRNQWRSPTAEKVFATYPACHTRSAGTSEKARTKVSAKLLQWADLVFVMEKKHKQMLHARFGDLARQKQIEVLDIPDDFAFMDEELVEILQSSVPVFLPSV